MYISPRFFLKSTVCRDVLRDVLPLRLSRQALKNSVHFPSFTRQANIQRMLEVDSIQCRTQMVLEVPLLDE